MAFEDITLLGKRISQLNPIPQDWSEEQVVELMTNGLIPLAKSNYDTFKTTLGFAFGYIPSWKNYSTKNGSSGGDNSIFIGKSTIIGNNSISLGDNNNGGNRIISLGFGNTSVDSGVCNFAELGYSNLVYNKVSEIQKLNNNVLEAIPTQSFIAGVANKSRHYNDIIIGYGNESQQPDSVEAGQEYDDDGFCVAIGFKNIIGRNYDIAIGHKSRAVGGENIALQHSDAEGYRNLALFNSNIVGTCNIASYDTYTDIYLPEYQGQNQINKYVTYNILHNTTFNYRRSENSRNYYSCSRNVLLDVACKAQADAFQQNFIYDGNGISSSVYFKVFTSHYVSNNVIFDNLPVTMSAPDQVIKNIIFNNNGVSITSKGSIYNNVSLVSSLTLQNSKHVFKNTITNSSMQGTIGLLHDNLIANSSLYFNDTDVDTVYNEFANNVVLANSHIEFNRNSSFWSGNRSYPFSYNFLHGVSAEDCYNCFAMSDAEGSNIKNSIHSFTLGDNNLNKTISSFAFGSNNALFRTVGVSVFGKSNNISTISSSDGWANNTTVTDGIVVGLSNNIKSDNFGRFSIIGSNNKITSEKGHSIFINGDYNTLRTITIVELTGEQIRQKQLNKQFVGHFKVNDFDVGYSPDNEKDGIPYDYSNRTFYGYDSYFYYDNGIVAEYNPLDITDAGFPAPSYTNITAESFINNYISGNLVNKTYYKISGSTVVPSDTNLYEGVFLIPTKCYAYYKDGYYYLQSTREEDFNTADVSKLYSYLSINGTYNTISTNVVGYTVFGMTNKISNTLTLPNATWSISNGFVQGNNNEASNGSNIVIFGNGNKSVGHNSVAIGSSLISSKWQTVIGKYNVSIDGPDRIIEAFDSTKVYTSGDRVVNNDVYYEYISPTDSSGTWDSTKWKEINPDSDKAIFIIGNGYSEKDDIHWQEEQYMHRSNAMVVYADGTIKARNIVTDEPLGKLVVNGALVDDATINIPNNKLSTLQTQQSNLTLVVDVESNDYAPNFLVEIEAQTNVTLTIKYTVNGSNLTTLPYNIDAGNTLESGKKYQVSCCGHGWVLGELTQPTP